MSLLPLTIPCFFHYVSRTDSIKPSLLFSTFGCIFQKGPFQITVYLCKSILILCNPKLPVIIRFIYNYSVLETIIKFP